MHPTGAPAPLDEGTTLTLHTDDTAIPTDQQTFADLGVLPAIEQSLAKVGITHPFAIQRLAIPLALEGVDLIGQARTGTGKTLAFGISTLQRVLIEGDEGFDELEHPGKPQALIVTPTRELTVQVARDLETGSTIRKARVLTVYGGVGYEPQLEALEKGVDVVVGTPGRLIDLANRGSLDLSHVRVAVLDEADEMLDLGFLPDVERLLGMTPKSRQTLLFSATMPAAIVSLARTWLQRPVNVRAEGHDAQATVPDTTQFVYQAHDLDKPEVIGRILQSTDVEKVMIFCRTKRAAQRLTDDLVDRGFPAASIHGDLNQAARERALKRFRAGEVTVLVATDVAARGIDVTGVSHVINNECPDDDKTYVHRIGRTGRAGAKGVAVTLVDWADVTRWKVINKSLDLDFPEPVETYSSSAHLFSDLDIPEGTKGRLVPEKPYEPKPREDRGGRGRSTSDERPRRERQPRERRRTRNGESVTDQDQGQTGDTAEPQAPRRRRRRRSRGGSSGSSAAAGE
ncbi:DEAD/DEAH box helicase [Aestuariimicrobium soli]|uniref:DEAD/DEAH box helicase n=1 Tax=Aestuariimicrobium soli TaxID=2035834 RepID=UPI003EB77EA8